MFEPLRDDQLPLGVLENSDLGTAATLHGDYQLFTKVKNIEGYGPLKLACTINRADFKQVIHELEKLLS